MGVNPCEVVSCTRPEGCLYGWPRSEAQRKLWEEAAGLTHHPSRKELIICSKHFLPSDFKDNKVDGQLRFDAVPTQHIKNYNFQIKTIPSTSNAEDPNEVATLKSRVACLEKELEARESLMREATTKVLSLAKQRDEARKALAEERQRIESELEVKVKLLEEENASLHAQIRQAAGTETNDKTPGNDDFLDDEDNIEKVLAKYRKQIVDMKKTTEAQLQKKEDQLKETQRVMVQQQKAVEAATSAPSSDTSIVGDYQPPPNVHGVLPTDKGPDIKWKNKYMNQWAEFVKCYNHVKVLQQKLKQMQMQHEGEVKQKNLTIAAFHNPRTHKFQSQESMVLVGQLRRDNRNLKKMNARLAKKAQERLLTKDKKQQLIGEFLKANRYTRLQRKWMIERTENRREPKRVVAWSDEDCLRAALLRSVSEQALNLLRATEPYSIPSDDVLKIRLKKEEYRKRLELRMRMVRDPNCTPDQLHMEMEEPEEPEPKPRVLPPPTWPAPDDVADSDGQASGLRQNEEIGGDAQMEGEEEEDYDLEDVKHIERELTEHGETVGDEQEEDDDETPNDEHAYAMTVTKEEALELGESWRTSYMR